ncbi:UDP-galactopyranose mutase [Vibrio cholerae]|uniref:UDP-galactopyranose mutase n=1 Tax=Vibrio cholerae TaxID=666 RepID=UPI0011D6CECB|nr:UDP-galactopyranose mutase [Vibrio cholerae]EKF9879152.1 UDP-galactopyranose mutase [Vibrio cholerae]TXY59301.1 UDP-galactopyranose mutase [Vibrio cholerae]BCN16889.1 putative mutase [Vibrio cholerae]BCN17277.1 putative mutase [Vibrio cholerae]GHX54690.1 UDP-galactopyranose mutase [Vibrio cholerae]
MKKYDYVIVGSGLFGSTCAHELNKAGKKVLVLEKRNHIGGNIYTDNTFGIDVHKYGAHIFHTNDKEIWDYVCNFVNMNRFTNSPMANYGGQLYNLPFNMNTFNKLWNVTTPKEAKAIIEEQRKEMADLEPKNLEEQAISLVGRDIYEKFIKGYTEKQWGRSARELPAFIIKRIPVRYTYDNNYFNDEYQGVPKEGYTKLVENMLEGIDVKLNTDFLDNKDYYKDIADTIIYTGPIDSYFDYKLGMLEYRSLRFETEVLDEDDFQGNAVVNYTEKDIPFTRIIEHKHFNYTKKVDGITIITKEYPKEWEIHDEPYYPVNDDNNSKLYRKYRDLAKEETGVIFGGRLAEYKYYDMHQVIASALYSVKKLIGE